MSGSGNDPTSSSGGSGSESSDQPLFLCRRCPGVEVRRDDRETHRIHHISQDMEKERRKPRVSKKQMDKKAKPGPKSKTKDKTRSVSSTASSLFEPISTPAARGDEDHEGHQALRKRPRLERGGVDMEDTSAAARRERAVVQHWKNAKGMTKKFLGA